MEQEIELMRQLDALGGRTDGLRVVVVGNGMVGHRFCEQLVQRDTDQRLRITVFGEERRPAYDRVHLSEFFNGKAADALAIADTAWYAERGLRLCLGERVEAIDRTQRQVITQTGQVEPYDVLVLATGSSPFVPPLPGMDKAGVFVYRTIDDLEAIQHHAKTARRAAVIGGGLLGLEAAKAVLDMGLQAHVVEFSDRLMPRQVDARGGALLRQAVEALGVGVHVDARSEAVLGDEAVSGLRFADGSVLDVDMVIVSAGIRPRDELARNAGLAVGGRGGIVVNDALQTSDPCIYAIGENALHRGMIYGLVAPGYDMAEVLARRLGGDETACFTGGDLSAKLKLLGVDVASFGDCFADGTQPASTKVLAFEDAVRGVYQKLVISDDGKKLLGGILVGDTEQYMALSITAKLGKDIPERPQELLFGKPGEAAGSAADFDDAAPICSCNNVSKGDIVNAISDKALTSLNGVKACTKAGTGCGGCMPFVTQIFNAELARSGREVNHTICEHFPYTRQELFWIVKLNRIESFDALLNSHGRGDGCELCRPAVASILAATWNDLVARHATIQDTNDRFLANIQRGGTYSVVPRVPGGEITPEKLIVLGEVARKYDLYCKITGGQRVDLFGARVDQLPDIWEELVAAGFESGHAYGKAMRTVKSCVGSTWCRYGVQDSTAFAIRVEERYRGIRAPHKLKSAVSGCIRECAEAQNKDFGIIATDKGWNIYLCGNGGSSPRHGDLVATDLPDDEAIRLLDRFLMFYIQTAKPLQRTARWLEELDGGIDYLKRVIIDDSLGICEQLEKDMQQLVDTYRCEWKAVVENPELRAQFREFANADTAQVTLPFVRERGQKRPADWPDAQPLTFHRKMPNEDAWQWQRMARVEQVPSDGGIALRHGEVQLALYHFARRGEWYATQNTCPHRKDNVLARGLLGSQGDEPKVACPLHKRTFSLRSGAGLSDPSYRIRTFPVRIKDGEVWIKLPPAPLLAQELGCGGDHACATHAGDEEALSV
jgi:nitrite reductase (NADH) large subunit